MKYILIHFFKVLVANALVEHVILIVVNAEAALYVFFMFSISLMECFIVLLFFLSAFSNDSIKTLFTIAANSCVESSSFLFVFVSSPSSSLLSVLLSVLSLIEGRGGSMMKTFFDAFYSVNHILCPHDVVFQNHCCRVLLIGSVQVH